MSNREAENAFRDDERGERVHERGGFGLSELGYYIALAVDEGRVRIEVIR